MNTNSQRAEAKFWFWRIVNALQGCGFYFDRENVMRFWKGTCPRPLRNDWSAKACIKAGDCGCDEQRATNGERITEVVGADGKGVAAPCAIDGCALMRGQARLLGRQRRAVPEGCAGTAARQGSVPEK